MVNWILFLLSFSLSFPLFLFVAHHVCYQTQLTLILKMDLRLHRYKFCSVVFLSFFLSFFFLQHSLQDDLQLLGSCLNFSSHRHTYNRAFICQKAGATELNHSTSCSQCLFDDRLVCSPALSLEKLDLIPSRPPLVAWLQIERAWLRCEHSRIGFSHDLSHPRASRH